MLGFVGRSGVETFLILRGFERLDHDRDLSAVRGSSFLTRQTSSRIEATAIHYILSLHAFFVCASALVGPMMKPAESSPIHSRPAIRGAIRRVFAISAFAGAVVLSLLVFPGVLPWMIGGWIGGHTLLAVRHRPSAVPLVACLTILFVKRPYWSPSLCVLTVVMAATAVLRTVPAGSLRPTRPFPYGAGTVLVFGVWIWFSWQWHADGRCSRPLVLDPTRSIACLGDSLTSGVPPLGGYPADLAQRLAVPVIDRGQAGLTAQQAVSVLAELVRARPQAVVVGLGGHDFLRGRNRTATRADLETIILTLRGADAEVVLMEIPRGFFTDPYAGLERELARQYGLELISDSAIRWLVLFGPYAPPGRWFERSRLSDDGLHPNERGNAYLARRVARALERMYDAGILAEAP